ncbi:hypothetical protein NIES4103_44610 [Nostoc sp. NIES-4103]|nr:hypothetical protein NIES4103_44610 [Nostoc sp. NIES-4103]
MKDKRRNYVTSFQELIRLFADKLIIILVVLN